MIIAVGSDKGSPGATTLAVALGMVWPGRRVVVECDPAGADLPFRLRSSVSGEMVLPEPSVGALAAATRLDAGPDELERLAQPTTVGFGVIPGMLTPERASVLRGLWPAVADLAAGWDGAAICDLGRLQPGSPVLPVARAATAVVLVAGHSTESFFRLRERVGALSAALADPTSAPALWVVVSGRANRRRDAVGECRELLDSVGSAARIAGFLPLDVTDAGLLWAGEMTRRLNRTPLMKAAQHIAEHLFVDIPANSTPEVVSSVSLIGTPR